MDLKCHSEGCDNPIKDEFEYYCPTCVNELIKSGKLKQKPKFDDPNEIHKALFG